MCALDPSVHVAWWGPVPGVWHSSEEFVAVVAQMDALIKASLSSNNIEWLHLPLPLHRLLPATPGALTDLPVWTLRFSLLKKLLQHDWRLVKLALQQQDAVRQFTFKQEGPLSSDDMMAPSEFCVFIV